MLIGLTGKAGSGKDTVASFLVEQHDFMPVAFADPLKKGLMAMFNLGPEYFSDSKLKEEDIPELDVSPRILMQTLGTEWARNLLDENIWVDIARRKIKAFDSYSVVVTDVRFENEAALIKELGGVILQVQREGLDGVGIQGHSSEVGRGVDADFVIVNDGTFEQLKEKVLCAIDEVLEPFLITMR